MFNISEKIIQYIKKLENEQTPVQNEQKTKTESDEKRAQLVETIKGLNDQLDGKTESVKLETMEFTPLTDKELENKASEKVDKKYEAKENSLKSKKDLQIKNLEIENQELKDSVKDKKKNVEDAYLELEESLNSDAIKRGIARSSIVSEQIKNLGVEKIRDLLGIDDALASELKSNSDKINSLEEEYVQAVNNLKIEKAVEISETIEKLKSEQNSQLEKVLKYNNNIKKQQATLEDKVSYPTKEEKAKIKSQIINSALDYFSSLPKEERILAFEADAEILELLGDNAKLVENYLRALA